MYTFKKQTQKFTVVYKCKITFIHNSAFLGSFFIKLYKLFYIYMLKHIT
jgi:hypothetical protein